MWGETEPCGIWDNFLVILKFHLRQYGLLSFFRVVARREAPQIRRFVETCRDRSPPSKLELGCVELGLPERKEILPFPGREGKTPLRKPWALRRPSWEAAVLTLDKRLRSVYVCLSICAGATAPPLLAALATHLGQAPALHPPPAEDG